MMATTSYVRPNSLYSIYGVTILYAKSEAKAKNVCVSFPCPKQLGPLEMTQKETRFLQNLWANRSQIGNNNRKS